MTNVVATDMSSGRRLLAADVAVSFTVVMPTRPGAEQATFDSIVNDLSAAAGAGGALSTSAGLASLGGTLDSDAFVAPTQANDMTTVESSESCVGANVVLKPAPSTGGALGCECDDYYVGKPAWDPEAARYVCSDRRLTSQNHTRVRHFVVC